MTATFASAFRAFGKRSIGDASPFQVCVIPFLRSYQTTFCLFKRADGDYWQPIAGGGEDAESDLEAVRREAWEEADIPEMSSYYRLQTRTSVSTQWFAARSEWSDDLYVIPLTYFAVEVESADVQLSTEHSSYQWMSFDDASQALHWQSDQVALWELQERLLRGSLIDAGA